MELKRAIDKLVDDCNNSEKNFYKHKSLILIGENAIGKSKLIKELVNQSLKKENKTIYYIDPLNRILSEDVNGGNTAVAKKMESLELDEIVSHRLKKGIFTRKDEFSDGNPGSAVALTAIKDDIQGDKHYCNLFRDFWNMELESATVGDGMLTYDTVKVKNGGEIQDLSSSESAKLRLLLEVDFAVNSLSVDTIIIDEFDEFFSEETLVEFVSKLLSYYSSTKFILVIHSLTSIVAMNDIDLALICDEHGASIYENSVNFMDAANIREIGQIEKIKSAMVSVLREETELEELIAHYVDFGNLTEEEKIFVGNIKRDELCPKEKIFYDYLFQRCFE